MLCPKCNAEYRLGFTRCSDCGIDLVERLSEGGSVAEGQEGEMVLGEYEPICRIDKDSDLIVLQSYLEGTGIPFYFKSHRIKKRGLPTSPATLMIEKNRVEEVRTLLKDFGLSFSPP